MCGRKAPCRSDDRLLSVDKGTGVCAFLLGLTLAVFPRVRGQYRSLRKWPVVDDEPKPLDR